MKLLTIIALLLGTTTTLGQTKRKLKTKKGKKENHHVLSTCMGPYPGYYGPISPVNGKVDVYFLGMDAMDMDFLFKLSGLEANCENCGIHIHEGFTCSSHELVMGHYWDSNGGETPDPWTSEYGAVYHSDGKGKVKGNYFLNSGYDIDENDGHAVVVHAQDGTRIACGVLQRGLAKCGHWKQKKAKRAERG